jgi:hypothetical protein
MPGDQLRRLTSRTSTNASVHVSDYIDRVKTVDVRVEQSSGGLGGRSIEDGGDTRRVAGTYMEYATRERLGGLGLKTIGWTGLRVWTPKPGRRFRGGTDGTWRHRGVRVEAKLSHERRGGRRMKITSSWIITSSGYVVRLKIFKAKIRIV